MPVRLSTVWQTRVQQHTVKQIIVLFRVVLALWTAVHLVGSCVVMETVSALQLVAQLVVEFVELSAKLLALDAHREGISCVGRWWLFLASWLPLLIVEQIADVLVFGPL